MRAFATALLVLLLVACTRTDPVTADLLALDGASHKAMAEADVQQAMARVQAAASPAAKAKVMRESALAIGRGRLLLQAPTMQSPEGHDLRNRMVAGFMKLGDGASRAADAFEASAVADLEIARRRMREGQVEFIAAGQDMVRLALARKVALGTAAAR